MKKSILNYRIFLVLLMIFTLACSQNKNKSDREQNPEKNKLTGKTFRGTVGSMCVETMPPNLCAGSMYYLILTFNENNVEITEEEVADCGKKITKNSFFSEWDIKNNTVRINKLIRYGQPLLIKSLVLKKNELTGREVDNSGNATEYIFTAIKK